MGRRGCCFSNAVPLLQEGADSMNCMPTARCHCCAPPIPSKHQFIKPPPCSAGVRDIYSAENRAIDASTPLVVLANRGTASASEVLAGALKDNRRAAVAGENTFGKGLIQTLVELSDGSAVAVTVAKYQTPAGIDINKVGGAGAGMPGCAELTCLAAAAAPILRCLTYPEM